MRSGYGRALQGQRLGLKEGIVRPFDVWGIRTVYATNDVREEDVFVTNGACKRLR